MFCSTHGQGMVPGWAFPLLLHDDPFWLITIQLDNAQRYMYFLFFLNIIGIMLTNEYG